MAARFTIPELIIKKREGNELTREEIQHFIQKLTAREVEETQIGSMLMAMFLKNLTKDETVSLTDSMMRSGDVLQWPDEWRGLVVDKHSTGGVGDKISLPLAPALAACGLKVPMISGRGLGFTGGTLDKLESIPGFSVSQSAEQMQVIMDRVGCCIVGQTAALVPADKILYAARDVSGTVDHPSLITASIVSKKAAENLDALVLDVKVGRAAFMKTEEMARELAQCMVRTSNGLGVKTVAVITRMDQPIGRTIGNGLEVMESIQCLQGKGPADLKDLVCSLGGHLLKCAGKASSADEGYRQIDERLRDGSALACFRSMMEAQGTRPEVAAALCDPNRDFFENLPSAQHQTTLACLSNGYVEDIDAMACARVSAHLGAGRQKASDDVNLAVGIELLVSVGDQLTEGSPWIKIHHDTDLHSDDIDMLQEALTLSSTPVNQQSLVLDIITE